MPTDGSATVPDQRGGTPELAMKEPVHGHLAPHAASVLMKLLYGARIARFDLLRQVIAWHGTCIGGLTPMIGACIT